MSAAVELSSPPFSQTEPKVTIDDANAPDAPPAKTRQLWLVTGFCSISGYLFGLDTGAIGPVTAMSPFLAKFPELDNQSSLGAIVATILMAASLASFSGGWFADKFSRKHTIALGAALFCLGAALEAGSETLAMFIIGRLLAGAGEGLFLSATGVYLIEISPPEVRGRSGSTIQLGVTLGVASGYFICYGTSNLGSSLSWRIPYIYQSLTALVLSIGCLHPTLLPHSPRWLIQQGRLDEAFAVMDSFSRGSSAEREKEEIRAAAALASTSGTTVAGAGREKSASMMETFRDPKTRWRTIMAVWLYGMQQLSGIDGILYYAPLLFSQAGLTSQEASFLASGISGIVLVVCTIPAQYWLMDRWGRRSTTIAGGLGMAACMITLGAIKASKTDSAFGKWLSVAVIYVFIATFSLTWAVCLKLFITEIQPTRTRATASSLAHSSNWLVNLAVALSTPVFLAKSPSAPYFVWGASLALTSAVCILYMPETLGKSLQEIDVVWDARIASARSIVHAFAKRPGSLGLHHGARRRARNEEGVELQDLPVGGLGGELLRDASAV